MKRLQHFSLIARKPLVPLEALWAKAHRVLEEGPIAVQSPMPYGNVDLGVLAWVRLLGYGNDLPRY